MTLNIRMCTALISSTIVIQTLQRLLSYSRLSLLKTTSAIIHESGQTYSKVVDHYFLPSSFYRMDIGNWRIFEIERRRVRWTKKQLQIAHSESLPK